MKSLHHQQGTDIFGTPSDTFNVAGSDTVELFDVFTVEALEERMELGGCGGCGDITSSPIYKGAKLVYDGYQCYMGSVSNCISAGVTIVQALCG